MALFDFIHKKIPIAEINSIVEGASEELAIRDLALNVAISYIAGAISKCEFKHYVNNAEVNDEIYYQFNVNPNPNQNSTQFITQVINTLIKKGEALVIKKPSGIYCADGFMKQTNGLKDDVFGSISVNGVMLPEKYKASDVFYYRLSDCNLSANIVAANFPYCQALSSALRAYKRNVGRKYKLLLSSYKAGDKEFQETYEKVISKQLKSYIESENGVYPQFNGYDLQDVTPTSVASGGIADISNIRKEIFETTASGLKIPISMLYGNITNINDVVNVFLTFCIDPIADMFSEENTRKTTTFRDWQKGNYIRVDTSSIKHVDVLEMADKADKLISSGIASINEVRNRMNFDEMNSKFGDKHFVTKNYTDIENLNQI